MKIHRFFVEQKLEDLSEIIITDRDVNHQIKKVLRLKPGETVCFFDKDRTEFFGKLASITQEGSNFVKEKINFFSNKNEKIIRLAPAVLKKDKMEWIVQKCTELGVFSFQPIISERTEKINLKLDRLEKIAKEASEQSEKNYLPKIKNPIELEQFLEEMNFSETQKCFALDFCETSINVSQMKNFNEITILIGPEGGWGEKDLELFEKYNVKKISLGEQILRAETASIAVSSLLLLA